MIIAVSKRFCSLARRVSTSSSSCYSRCVPQTAALANSICVRACASVCPCVRVHTCACALARVCARVCSRRACVCSRARVRACMRVCPRAPACARACVPACLRACLPACLRACVPACVPARAHARARGCVCVWFKSVCVAGRWAVGTRSLHPALGTSLSDLYLCSDPCDAMPWHQCSSCHWWQNGGRFCSSCSAPVFSGNKRPRPKGPSTAQPPGQSKPLPKVFSVPRIKGIAKWNSSAASATRAPAATKQTAENVELSCLPATLCFRGSGLRWECLNKCSSNSKTCRLRVP